MHGKCFEKGRPRHFVLENTELGGGEGLTLLDLTIFLQVNMSASVGNTTPASASKLHKSKYTYNHFSVRLGEKRNQQSILLPQ